MDVRDINEVPAVAFGQTIEAIFELQKKLLEKYLGIEKLEPYPYNLNLPKHQIILKDFIARVVEELGEAFESFEKLVHLNTENKLKASNVIPALYNFNEELADALHFLVETMIVVGITPKFLEDWAINSNFPASMQDYRRFNTTYKALTANATFNFKTNPKIDEVLSEVSDTFITGGRNVSIGMLEQLKVLSWEVTYPLQLARNTLKNKPWKQSQMISDTKMFNFYMALSFQNLLALTQAMGIDEEALFAVYYKKNQINLFRIKSQY